VWWEESPSALSAVDLATEASFNRLLLVLMFSRKQVNFMENFVQYTVLSNIGDLSLEAYGGTCENFSVKIDRG